MTLVARMIARRCIFQCAHVLAKVPTSGQIGRRRPLARKRGSSFLREVPDTPPGNISLPALSRPDVMAASPGKMWSRRFPGPCLAGALQAGARVPQRDASTRRHAEGTAVAAICRGWSAVVCRMPSMSGSSGIARPSQERKRVLRLSDERPAVQADAGRGWLEAEHNHVA